MLEECANNEREGKEHKHCRRTERERRWILPLAPQAEYRFSSDRDIVMMTKAMAKPKYPPMYLLRLLLYCKSAPATKSGCRFSKASRKNVASKAAQMA